MKLSNRGKSLIKKYEGLRLTAYKCPAGVWTIGYGHTAGVFAGQKISEKQADEFFDKDIKQFEDAVNSLVKVPLKQGQFDALVSFTFNLGIGSLRGSTLLRLLNSGNYTGAGEQFLIWNKIQKGKKLVACEGLTKRRKAEREMFLNK